MQIINPHTRQRYNVTREFCAAPCYASIYKRLLRDTLRRNPSLAPILSRQVPSARAVARPPAAAAAAFPAAGGLSRASASHGGSGVVDVDGLPLPRGRDVGRPSTSPTGTSAAAGARTELENGSYRRPSSSASPPGASRSHQLPRGPGGIDILSGPATPAKEGAENGAAVARAHVRAVSGAGAAAVEAVVAAGIGGEGVDDAVVAAAAMLGLGAEVFAGRGGGAGAAAAPAESKSESESAPVAASAATAVTGGKGEVKGDAGAGANAVGGGGGDCALSNGHADMMGGNPDGDNPNGVEPNALHGRQDVSGPEEVAAAAAAVESGGDRSEEVAEVPGGPEPLVSEGRAAVDEGKTDLAETSPKRDQDGEGGGVVSHSSTADEEGRNAEGGEASGGATPGGLVKEEEGGVDPEERGDRDGSSENAEVRVIAVVGALLLYCG